ncbi:MAG: hypothetical protein R3F30_06590 [Planctomycetota bacterium]
MRPTPTRPASLALTCCLVLGACASGPADRTVDRSPSLAKEIARIYGADHWDEVVELGFTFEVKRSDGQVVRRQWTWDRVKELVTLHRDGADHTIHYGHPRDEGERKLDAAFLNDSFWLLFPLHLDWDDGITIAEDRARSPFMPSDEPVPRLRVRYSARGGYTPGDAYDLYVRPDWRIDGWAYHRGGVAEPTLLTSWRDHRRFGPLLLSLERKSPDGRFELHFTDVHVRTRGQRAPDSGPASRPAAQDPR